MIHSNTPLKKSSVILLISNLITIYLAISQDWNLKVVMLIYVIQSLIIGFFHIFKILNLKEFTTEKFRINGVQPPPTKQTKHAVAIFFALHFGIFNIVYLSTVLSSGKFIPVASAIGIFVASIAFFINHYYSYKYNKESDSNKKPNIGHMMFFPYLRIIPMHLVIVSGTFLSNSGIETFMFLKTLADLGMHIVEHKIKK